MEAKILVFKAEKIDSIRNRFRTFIEWAQPNGTAGINNYHQIEYDPTAPFFDWSPKIFEHSDNTKRTWLIKQEYLGEGRSIFTRARKGNPPKILDRDGLFSEGQYLEFSKAYINVTSFYRNLRSEAKPISYALIYLERALRDLNSGTVDVERINLSAFLLAINHVEESDFSQGKKYDIGKELEIMAGMLQNGYQSKTLRFAGMGFRLLAKPFTFESPIPGKIRKRAITRNTEDLTEHPDGRLTAEEVAAVGLAYRRAVATHGDESQPALFAAIAGFPLTTVSMRISDMLPSKRDAVYQDPVSGRRRIRIFRPKTGVHQDLPIAKRLAELAVELFGCLLKNTLDAHEALSFYTRKFGDDFDSINELYIPRHLRDKFKKEFLTAREVRGLLSIRASACDPDSWFPQRFREKLEVFEFVECPGDVSPLVARNLARTERLLKIGQVEAALAALGFTTRFPLSLERNSYVSKAVVKRFLSGIKDEDLTEIFKKGQASRKYVKSSELKQCLLEQFKSRKDFPHWPYIDKAEATRVDEALLVSYQLDYDKVGHGENQGLWWIPGPVRAALIGRWITRDQNAVDKAPLLFSKTGVRLKDGTYPSISYHATRKYHHTQALLAGAHEVFLDELAGRKNGAQSDHYDLRSPHEILAQSIDTFDPDIDFNVEGPVAEQLPQVKLVDRKAFLFANAAPKHVTDIGGCATDWSLEPCKQYGDCTRCDQHLWRKGDKKRLEEINLRKAFAFEMISIAEQKIAAFDEPPRSLLLQYQQFKDELTRLNAILAAEADERIPVGTIVTFPSAPKAMTRSELVSKLRAEMAASSKKKSLDWRGQDIA